MARGGGRPPLPTRFSHTGDSRSLSYEPNDPAEAYRIINMIQPKLIITNDPAEAYRMSRMIQPKPIIIRFMARGDGKPPFTKTERFAMTPRGIAKRISSHGRQIRNENRDNRKPTHRGRHSASAFVVTVTR